MTSTVRLTSVLECIEQLSTLLNMNSKTEDGLTMRRSGSLTLGTEWEGKYFFHKVCERSKCLLCCISVVKRKFNVERHYKNIHATN